MQNVQEILNARVTTLEARKTAVEQEDYMARIDEEVERYRAELTARFTAEREAKLGAVDGEIKALRNWMAELAEMPEEIKAQPTHEPVATPIVATIPAAFQRFKTL